MAKKDKKEAASEYAQELLALIPEAQRGAVAEALKLEPVLDHLGEGVLRRSDHSRALSEVAAEKKAAEDAKAQADREKQEYAGKRAEITNWYQDFLQKQEAKPAESQPGQPPQFDPTKYLSREDAARLVVQAQQQGAKDFLAWQAVLTPLGIKHYADYGAVLDVNKLIAHATAINKPVDQAYDDMTRELREAKEEKAGKEREQKLRAEIEADVRAQLTGPYIVSNQEPLATLAGLDGGNGQAPKYGVDAAVAHWNRLQAERR